MTARRPIADISQVTDLQTTLDAKAALQDTDLGGQILLTPRVPTLAVDRLFPNPRNTGMVVHGISDAVVTVGNDYRVRTSTEAGWIGWAETSGTSAPAVKVGHRGCYMVLATAGVRLAIVSGTPPLIYRSTNSGQTWTLVHTLTSNTELLTSQSWCQDASTGYIYYVEYSTSSALAEICIYRSTDDGATFTKWHAFPGPGTADAARIRHLHCCQYDPTSQRVYFTAGDATPYRGGIYRVNAAGDGVEEVVTNVQGQTQLSDDIYCISLMFFDTHIAWGDDYAAQPNYVYRIARSEIGSDPTIERIYRVAGPTWGSARALEDNSAWIITTASESGLDSCAHFYAVTDNGADVYEVGMIPVSNDFCAFTPAGPAEQQGVEGRMWFTNRSAANPNLSFRAVYGRSTLPLVTPPEWARITPRRTVSSGQATLNSTDSVHYFGAAKVPTAYNRLAYIACNIARFSGSGQVRCEMYNLTTGAAIQGVQTNNASTVYTFGDADGEYGNYVEGEYRTLYTVTPGNHIGFRLTHLAGTGDVVCSGDVTFAWTQG